MDWLGKWCLVLKKWMEEDTAGLNSVVQLQDILSG